MTNVKAGSSKTSKMGRPALSPEARENQLISLAVDLAEKQLRDGTASSQVITHFLKLGTTKAELEKEKLKKENILMEAKTKAIESDAQTKIDYNKVIEAMKKYSGGGDSNDFNY